MKILVLSPHADDAVFSCFDHIRDWRKSGHTVDVCTVFSKFTPSKLSDDVRGYMANSGYTSVQLFEKARQHEDRRALNYLGVHFLTPRFIDGAFYEHGGKNVYPSFGELFSGRIAENDARVLSLAEYLDKICPRYDTVVSPIGIGSQADHVITALCAKNYVKKNALWYYYDVPYYFFPHNWKRKYIHTLFKMRMSLKWITKDKIRCMNMYESQTNLIIRNNRRFFFREKRTVFPEIIVSPW